MRLTQLVAAGLAQEPPFLAAGASRQCGNLQDVAGHRAVFVPIVNALLSLLAVAAKGFLSGFSNALLETIRVFLANAVDVESGASAFPETEYGLVASLPELQARHSLVCVVPYQPSLLVNRIPDGNVR